MENGTSEGFNLQSLHRLFLYIKRRLKLNRFLLVIDTKKGVVISAITVIIVDLIDLLWNLSMTFGPLNSTMTTLLLIETFLVFCVSSVLLYAMKTDNKPDLRSILLTWLVVVAIDYTLRATLNFSSLIISGKASTTARVMRSLVTIVILVLVAHCWQCVFTYYDDSNGKITTVKITPSDDKGRSQFTKRQMMMMRPASAAHTELSAANLERGAANLMGSGVGAAGSSHANSLAAAPTGANMLRAPTEDAAKMRW